MNGRPGAAATQTRIAWVDVAKGIGIAIVFYGHFVEHFIRLSHPAALTHMKWVYSFHIPLFFLLLGYIYKQRDIPPAQFLKRQVLTRLVPAWAFNAVSMLAWIRAELLRGDAGWIYELGWWATVQRCIGSMLEVVVLGRPVWNVVTWFLICLFVVELWQYLLRPLLRANWRLAVSIVLFIALAAAANANMERLQGTPAFEQNWWHVLSALGAMIFYQAGILLRRLGLLSATGSRWRSAALAAFWLAVLFLTFDRNHGFYGDRVPVVLMVDGYLGKIGWYLLTGFAGSLAIVYSSQLLATSRVLNNVGQITLALFCLDGVIDRFVNPYVARALAGLFPRESAWALTAVCIGVTIASIVVCIPIIWLLERYAPILLGRRAQRGRAGLMEGEPQSALSPAARRSEGG